MKLGQYFSPQRLTIYATVLAPSAVAGDSSSIENKKSNAGLEFRIVIPPVIRILENFNPSLLQKRQAGRQQVKNKLLWN